MQFFITGAAGFLDSLREQAFDRAPQPSLEAGLGRLWASWRAA